MEVLYTATATATGGRDGKVISDDSVIDIALKTPKELGGPGGHATNPEQLFAAGYSACFDSALKVVIRNQKAQVTSTAVTGKVSIGKDPEGGFKIGAELLVKVEGVDQAEALELVKAAHQVCPYSKATRGNIEVKLLLAQ
ncbi:organic hydroperoxide resistance protein [Chengkuizengella axinellae]|uniref:Organic hydroperoxide resistance protein n=1 Tax=Chengkuizengella axinellae TaxID=3064388 RepID=A0ABT9IVA7_9BACL|nr:organic hydroperoxide resistance protein [Chengkuizengella sp. 2205SS18-9]MDP5273294.1 organic hydroperoxide resistance protein [Chengkuizengella sp. 2205SS18-9]